VEEPDAHLARLRGHGALGVRHGLAQVGEQTFGPPDESFPRLRETYGASNAFEERDADVLLEPGDLAADR
jgi:hypothetical protein